MVCGDFHRPRWVRSASFRPRSTIHARPATANRVVKASRVLTRLVHPKVGRLSIRRMLRILRTPDPRSNSCAACSRIYALSSRPPTRRGLGRTPGGGEARDSAPQRRQRRRISQLIALKRLASTAQSAVQRRGCAVLRRVCAVTVFQPAGCIGCRERSDQARLRSSIDFWKLFFSVQSD
jgi:hypothetical protein